MDVFVNIDELRNDSFDLDDSGYFNQFLFDSLNFIDLRNDYRSINDFLNDLLGSDDFSHNIMDRYDFFNYFLNLVDLSSNIRNLFNDLLDFSINHNFLLGSYDFDRLRLYCVLDNNFFKYSGHLNDFFYSFSHWYKFLHDTIDWD